MVIISLLFSSVYDFSARNGLLDESELYKYEKQGQSKIGILSGRGDFIIGILAATDAPLLGHGSYAEDKSNYKLLNQLLLDVDESPSIIKGRELIPSHSHLIGAWVFSGFLGLVFWLYIIWIHLRYINRFSFYMNRFWIPFLYLVMLCLWNILFSPFSQRPLLSLVIIIIVKVTSISFDEVSERRGVL
jgi:hypothetical protein